MKVKLNNGDIITVLTQQYDIGLYVCVYSDNNRMLKQFSVDVSKEQFIQDVKNNKVFEGEYINN